MSVKDGVKWYPKVTIEKYTPDQVEAAAAILGYEPKGADFDRLEVAPDEITKSEGNQLTNAGLTRITSLITGAGGQAFTATSGRIGVGNGVTAWAGTDTDLSASAGSSNRWFQILDGSTPTLSVGTITARATFATGDGNFAWNEWCWDASAPTAASSAVVGTTMLNRKVTSLGTKASGAVWVFTTTVTLS